MTGINTILAHHAGARLFRHTTGRYPSAEELASLVDDSGGAAGKELSAYKSRGSLAAARDVLADTSGLEVDLAQLYQRLRVAREKKTLGQVFTPEPAVEAVLALLGSIAPGRIIDPACGAGEFLLSSARRWPGVAAAGLDIDYLALAVARTRLFLAGTINIDLVQGNALNFPLAQEYDLVLGNPPWGSTLGLSDIQGFTISRGRQGNSFVYFLELAARLLKPGGHIAMVLPEAFTKVWAYQGAREWLLHNFAVSGLHYVPNLFKDYYAPAIFLTAVRLPAHAPKAIPVWYQRGLKQDKLKINALPPRALQAQRFNINWHPRLEELWNKCCRGAVFLREASMGAPLPPEDAVADFSLGIVTGSNRRFVSAKPLSPRHLPVLSAGDVSPFSIAPASRWLEYNPEALQQAAPLEKYQVPAKIVYKFIAREITAAADYSGSLTLNNLNIIIPLRLPFSLEYLVALLNSKLLNTLYMYKFFTGKVLTRHLKQLPLYAGSRKEQEEITALAGKLAGGEGGCQDLDRLVFDLYGLNCSERDLITEQNKKLRDIFFV